MIKIISHPGRRSLTCGLLYLQNDHVIKGYTTRPLGSWEGRRPIKACNKITVGSLSVVEGSIFDHTSHPHIFIIPPSICCHSPPISAPLIPSFEARIPPLKKIFEINTANIVYYNYKPIFVKRKIKV